MANISREEDIRLLVDQLKNGGLILYPTDTVWGIGCDAQNEKAVERIYTLTQIPKDQSLVLLVSNLEMLKNYVELLPPKAGNLIEFYERPITILYDRPQNLPKAVLSSKGAVAIRVVQDPFCQQIIDAFGGAVVAAAANMHGQTHARHYAEISQKLLEGVDYTAWAGRTEEKKERSPSSIVKINDKEELVFIRK